MQWEQSPPTLSRYLIIRVLLLLFIVVGLVVDALAEVTLGAWVARVSCIVLALVVLVGGGGGAADLDAPD